MTKIVNDAVSVLDRAETTLESRFGEDLSCEDRLVNARKMVVVMFDTISDLVDEILLNRGEDSLRISCFGERWKNLEKEWKK